MKKLLIVAFVAIFATAFVSCNKDKGEEKLIGTEWTYVDNSVMDFMGVPVNINLDATMTFADINNGSLASHVIMSAEGMGELANETLTEAFTYSFDGEKGVLTIPATDEDPEINAELTLIDETHLQLSETTEGETTTMTFTKKK